MFLTYLDKARQWTDVVFIILMLAIALYARPSHLAVPESFGWVWRSFVTKGLSFF